MPMFRLGFNLPYSSQVGNGRVKDRHGDNFGGWVDLVENCLEEGVDDSTNSMEATSKDGQAMTWDRRRRLLTGQRANG